MDELSVAYVNTDMGDAGPVRVIEEDEISLAQFALCHRNAIELVC